MIAVWKECGNLDHLKWKSNEELEEPGKPTKI